VERHTYRLDLAYDGTGFAGFRRQPGQRTVESTLVQVLQPFVPELEGVAVAGRTDRGVHATGQVVSFWARQPLQVDELRRAVDQVAPGEIVTLAGREVPRSFHASFSATKRRYTYLLDDQGEVQAERVNALLEPLLGPRCFAAFGRRLPAGRSTRRRLLFARAHRQGPWLRFDLCADGFLRMQVRVMVATALREVRAGAPTDALLRLAECGDPTRAAAPAAAVGLHLAGIDYPPMG